ncbi:MAG: HPr family phosphocarrier protein [Lachnospiraceae bacterium]|nr:HPr family phosphocarrier protein [Lachnospiraceae bacterium]
MKEFTYVITDEVGLHARPANVVCKAAKKYASKITVEFGGKTAELRKLMQVMSLGARTGDEIKITIEGEDEDLAFEELPQFFAENL